MNPTDADAGSRPPRPAPAAHAGWRRVLLWVQGVYYLLTGAWPLVSIETFQRVTGRKTDHLVTGRESDHWLVMTVGVLITAVALTLLVAAWRGRPPVEVAVLALASALGLTAIDVIYVARQVILPVYLLDAAAEVVLIVAWALVLWKEGAPARGPTPWGEGA